MTDTSKIPSSRISNSTFENNQILLINDGNIIINDTSITNYILEINQPTTISISSNIILPTNISLPIQLEIKKTDINATISFSPFLACEIAEVILYNSELTEKENESVIKYLKGKYHL